MITPIPIVTDVFVYGTLKRGQCREQMWPRPPLSICPGFVRGWLFDLGPYPAMWCGDCHELGDDGHDSESCSCDWIEGEIWSLAEAEMAVTIKTLDEIEETNQPQAHNYYDQILVRVYESPTTARSTTRSRLALTYQFSRLNDTDPASRIVPVAPANVVVWPNLHG